MKKKIIFIHTLSMFLLGVCCISAIIIFKPYSKNPFKNSSWNIPSTSSQSTWNSHSWNILSPSLPELWNVVKNSSWEIINITLKKSPLYLPSDSLFINWKDAVPLSEVSVWDNIYLNKIWPKFDLLVQNETIHLEICRLSDCSKKLILKMPSKNLPSNEQNTGSIDTNFLPLNPAWNPLIEQKWYTLLGMADFTDNDDMKTVFWNIDGHYNWMLDKKWGYNPKNWVLSFNNLVIWQKYEKMAYVLEVNSYAFRTKRDMYLLNFDWKYRGIKYTYFDKKSNLARIFINNKIHTLPASFWENTFYTFVLETEWEAYTISLFGDTWEKIWAWKWVEKIETPENIFIGSKYADDSWQWYIKSFSIYKK